MSKETTQKNVWMGKKEVGTKKRRNGRPKKQVPFILAKRPPRF